MSAASSSTAVPSSVVSMPKLMTSEERIELSHVLSNLCALGLVKRVVDGIGVVRYQPVKRAGRIA